MDYLIDHAAVRKELAAVDMATSLQALDEWNVKHGPTNLNYTPVANFLNYCVDQCSAICYSLRDSEGISIGERGWLKDILFVVYDKDVGNRVQGAHTLKPNVAGVDGGPMLENFCAYWSLAKEQRADDKRQIEVPVDVKESWISLAIQLATYARAMFAVMPLRCFVLGIGVNHQEESLRFFIFHRGGLSMSSALRLLDSDSGPDDEATKKAKVPELELQENRRIVLKLMLSVMVWQGPTDAGFTPFTDGRIFLLPHPLERASYFEVVVVDVIYFDLSVHGRSTLVARILLRKKNDPLPNVAQMCPTRFISAGIGLQGM